MLPALHGPPITETSNKNFSVYIHVDNGGFLSQLTTCNFTSIWKQAQTSKQTVPITIF